VSIWFFIQTHLQIDSVPKWVFQSFKRGSVLFLNFANVYTRNRDYYIYLNIKPPIPSIHRGKKNSADKGGTKFRRRQISRFTANASTWMWQASFSLSHTLFFLSIRYSSEGPKSVMEMVELFSFVKTCFYIVELVGTANTPSPIMDGKNRDNVTKNYFSTIIIAKSCFLRRWTLL